MSRVVFVASCPTSVSSFCFSSFAVLISALVAAMISTPYSRGQESALGVEGPAAKVYTEEEQRQIDLAGRFLTILAQNPRRGTALDRVYGHHIEFGTLDPFIESLEETLKREPDNGEQWMLLGLFQSQRGSDNEATKAFAQAEKLRTEDPIASYYLGLALLRIGEPREAVEAMERAIARKPSRTDTLEIFQQLGRIHQRAQRTEEALAIWQRLEELFPGDPRVLEQIAVTLAEEGQPDLALKRYLQLAEITRDDYRRTMYRIETAELKVKTNDLDGGVAEFEALLDDLNPEGWLFRDVRRRIENVFLRSSDQDALVAYYEKWLEENPEDVEAMARLARFLASAARMPESREWMEKALRLAPSRADLRKAYIDQLVDDQQFSEALAQYEKLSEADPSNADVLRDWGKLVLRDRTQDIENRRTEATRIWRKMLANRADHALTHAQVADLFRAAEMNEQALKLYEKAVELAPGDPQYREFLGEFHHIQKRNEEALETWAAIAAPPNRTADNLSRLAEVYQSFGYLDQALVEITAATVMDAKDFALQIRAADYHNQAEKYDEALNFIAAAERLADDPERMDTVIRERIEVYQSSQQLEKRIEDLAASIQANEKPTWEQWHVLARYHEAARAWPEATDAIESALKVAPDNIVALTTAARIAEASGELKAAADLSRQLAEVDRRYRADHWMNVARLEIQLGRADEAIAAAEELIRSAPGNTEHYEFYAQTCFRLGRSEEGIDALRKAVRINPNEPALIMSLGSALADQLNTREAIELYWRAFEKTEDLDDMTTLTTKLVPLYEQINQLDQLLERFDRLRREEDQRREMTICLAQAHQTSGNTIAAQQELESLLSENTRDTNLLQQLAKLCEASGDQEAAIAYRRQLVTLAPGHETEFPLAKLLQENGQRDEASDIFVRLTQREEDPIRLLRSLDSLLAQGSFEAVIRITEPLLSQQREDWELLYREGVAYASMERFEEAEIRFQRILDLRLPLETMGAVAKSRYDQQLRKAKSDNLRGLASRQPTRMTPLQMVSSANGIRQTTGLLNNQDPFSSNQSRGLATVWSPEVLGTARMAAWGWRLRFERDAIEKVSAEEADEAARTISQRLAEEASQPQATPQAIMDAMFVAHLSEDTEAIVENAKLLARDGGKEEKSYFLSTLARRIPATQNQRAARDRDNPAGIEPLSEADIELMLQCVVDLDQQDEDQPPIPTGQIAYASNGQAYILIGGSYQPLYGVFRGGSMFLSAVMAELRLAGRADKAEEMLQAELDRAKKANDLAQAIVILIRENNQEEVPIYFDRWKEAMLAEIEETTLENTAASGNQNNQQAQKAQLASITQPVSQWIGILGEAEENQKVAEIFDSLLDVHDAQLKSLKSSPSSAARQTSTSSRQMGMSTYYGRSNSYNQYTVPLGDPYVSTIAVQWMRQVYEVFNRNDVANDLTDLLQRRIEQADETTRGHDQLLLATLFDWMGQRDDMIELVSAAAPRYADDLAFRFHLIELHENAGDYDLALEMIDETEVRDQKMLQQRELIAIGLAERLGDIDRARAAAERLFGLRLDSQTQLSLVERMRRLGMHAMADAVLVRTERSAGNDPGALASLMTLYQGQGKVDHANQLARLILLRTTSPLTSMANAARNPRNVSNATDPFRRQALQVLRQGGGLTDLIQQMEQRIERTNGTPRMYELLVEYYEADGRNKEVVELLNKAIELKPGASGLRLKLGQLLEREGKHDEACKQYLAVLRERPDWILENIYQYRSSFTAAGRMRDLAEAVSELDIRSIRQPYYLIDLANNLLRQKDDIEVAISLLEKVDEHFPHYRQNLLSSVDQAALQHAGFLKFVMKTMLPDAATIKTNPWAGVDSVRSYDNNGGVNSHFDFLLEGIRKASEESRQEVEKSIAATAQDNPNWLGGQVILAKMDLDASRPNKAEERLAKVFADSDAVSVMPSNACWIVGTLCERFDGLKPQGRELFEQAVRTDTTNRSQLNYSPLRRLVQIYKAQGENEAAKELLLKSLNSAVNQYDVNYQAYLQFQNVGWVAEQLLELGYPGESLRLQQGMLSDKDLAHRASQVGGDSVEQYRERLQTGIRSAITALASGEHSLRVEDFLAVRGDIRPGQPAVELMLQFPRGEELSTAEISSSMAELFTRLAEKPEIAARLERSLSELSEQFPGEVSIATLRVMAHSDPRDKAILGDLTNLVRQLEETPWEPIPEGRRPNARQRREAALSIPLWLVAQRLFGTEDWEAIGQPLAERALEGARRQLEGDAAIAILYQWGRRHIEHGDAEAAERRWHEALTLATRRPGQSGRFRSSPVTDSRAEDETQRRGRTIAPLTISQFNIAMILAKAGADHGMPELSQQATFESLLGGTPQPDPPPGSNGTQGIRIVGGITYASSSAAPSVATNPLETKVAQEVQAVVGKWTPESYAPVKTYELLRDLVLPPHRAGEVLLYPNQGQLSQGETSSLAPLLIRWAGHADHLPQLAAAVSERAKLPQARIPGGVLQTLIAIAQRQDDEAKKYLEELTAAVTQLQGSLPLIELACHAALPAFEHEPLREAAYPILSVAVETRAQSIDQNQQLNTDDKLAQLVNEQRVREGNSAEVTAYYDRLLTGRQAFYARYGSQDYAFYLQQRELASIANQAGKLGAGDIALDYLGRTIDFKAPPQYSLPSVGFGLALAVDHARGLPPEDRYQLWADWTLPTENRQSLRFVAERIEPAIPTKEYRSWDLDLEPLAGSGMLSNFSELVEAARQAGRSEDLIVRAQAAVEQKLPEAESLLTLTLVATGDRKKSLEPVRQHFATLIERYKARDENIRRAVTPDMLVYFACIEQGLYFDETPDHFAKLVADLRQTSAPHNHFPEIRAAYASLLADKYDAASRPIDDPHYTEWPRFKHWTDTTLENPESRRLQAWWVARENQATHLLGDGSGFLMLKYPLAGNFEVTFDCYHGTWGEGYAGFGGVIVESQGHSSGNTTIRPLANHETLQRNGNWTTEQPGEAHIRIRSVDGKWQYYQNGFLLYEEGGGETSPWLTLASLGFRHSNFRNFKITGEPSIPREVPLFSGNRMDGWSALFYGHSQPRHRLMAEKPGEQNSQIARQQAAEPKRFDWQTEDGVLTSHAEYPHPEHEGFLFYQRPLESGETFRYEFYYQSGTARVSPTLGRLALQLEPGGVETHWMSSTAVNQTAFFTPRHSIAQPQFQRSQELPLLPEQWNSIELSIEGDQVLLRLNNELIYERPAADFADTRFGLFHYRDEKVEVRNAVLTGDWPEDAKAIFDDGLFDIERPLTPGENYVVEALLPRELHTPEASGVVRSAREMSDAEAFEYLAEWVLPGDHHQRTRIVLSYLPLREQEDKSGLDAVIGRILCPADELVQVAARLGRLDNLRTRIAAIQPVDSVDARHRQALLTLVEIAAGDIQAATSALRTMLATVKGGLPQYLSPSDRVAELIVALRAGESPVLWQLGHGLANHLQSLERGHGNKPSHNDRWHTMISVAQGAIQTEHMGLDHNAEQLTQWASVPYLGQSIRMQGFRPSTWVYDRGALTHLPSDAWSQLFFQSPLRGKFEILARRSTYGHKEVSISIGRHAAEPKHDLKGTHVITVMHGGRDTGSALNLPVWDQSADFRIVVDGNRVTTYTNGVKIHEESFSRPLDPWVVLQARSPKHLATIRDLRIVGTPEIPDEIDLINIENWNSWRSDLYSHWASFDINSGAPYIFQDNEIVGNLREIGDSKNLESLFMYSRPMLEDGEITFETYYDPGKFEIHPAVGGIAYLLEPEGVATHRLTDARWESRDLDHGNRTPASEIAPSWKLKDWNQVRLILRGNQLSIEVNGTQVHQAEVTEPPTERFFGLFRYAEQTRCRVRNVVYRGDWPKEFPAVDQQQLAYSEGGPYPMPKDQLAEQFEFKLGLPLAQLKGTGLKVYGPEDQLSIVNDRMRIHLQNADANPRDWPGVEFSRRIEGDVEITLDYHDLKFTKVKSGWGTSLDMELGLDDPTNSLVTFGVGRGGNFSLKTAAMLRRELQGPPRITVDEEIVKEFSETGRLRLVRKGGRVHCLLADGKDGSFRLIHSLTIGDAPITRIAVRAKASEKTGELTADLGRLIVRETKESLDTKDFLKK